MRELWRHLRETGNTRVYLWHLFKRHRKTIAFIFLAAVFMLAFYLNTNQALKRERTAQLTTCARVQLLRDQANGNSFRIYDTFKQVVEQQQAVINSGRLKGVALKQARKAVARAQEAVNTSLITGPTDCIQAVDHPDRYAAPAPEFISRNGPNVKLARQRAMELVRKAKTQSPLYTPDQLLGNQSVLKYDKPFGG